MKQEVSQLMGVEWIPFPDDRFVVNGLWWWPETRPRLQRLPERMKRRVREPVWALAQSPSGGRIRFATDASALGLRLHYPALHYMNNMPRTGQLGVDLWVGGEYWKPVIPTESSDVEEVCFANLPAERREVCLYLGLYGPVEVRAIGLSEGASIEPPAAFAVERPVAYYGSSITQGGCASRAGMSYQAIVSRALKLDFVNLGFSGQGRGEPELAEAMAEIEACCYVIDFCQNCPSAEYLEEVYAPFLGIIRQARPETPMICVTPIFSTSEVWGGATRLADMRTVIREAVAEREREGDEHITLVEGYDMLGPDDRDGLVDASHPNDIGFSSMARGLEPALRQALGI
jgi:hypothetical protein